MGEQVAATGSQQVHLLANVILQFVEACFGCAHLSLNLRQVDIDLFIYIYTPVSHGFQQGTHTHTQDCEVLDEHPIVVQRTHDSGCALPSSGVTL